MTQPRRKADLSYNAPSQQEQEIAASSSKQLAALIEECPHCDLKFINGINEITVPPSATRLLADILMFMAEGESVTLIPHYAELTTQQAANYLNVSRPFVVKLLENGALPYHKVGKHRRVLFKDIQKYKELSMRKRKDALDELTKQAQDMKMGY